MVVSRATGGLTANADHLYEGEGWTDLDRALPPGRYAVDVTHEGRTHRKPVEVAAGKTIDVAIPVGR